MTVVFFLATSVMPAYPQSLFPAYFSGFPSISSNYTPAMIKGMVIHPEDPFLFDFIIHPGEENLLENDFQEESSKLIKYFMAGLTVPETEMWVNLSPIEKNRIIPEVFSKTEMGRDLLTQDYLLKQLTASLLYPENEIGKKFWEQIYEKLPKTTEIPTDVLNKVWIVPDGAEIYTHQKGVFVVKSRLKVLMESEYRSQQPSANSHQNVESSRLRAEGQEILKEIILPAIEHKINTDKAFANLRQIYNSLILATWYKNNLKESLLSRNYVDQKKVEGIALNDPTMKERIYNQYLDAFKKGAFNYIKEEYDPQLQKVISRKYISGGADFKDMAMTTSGNSGSLNQVLQEARNVKTRLAGTVDAAMAVHIPLGSKMPLASNFSRLESVEFKGKTSNEVRDQLSAIRESAVELPMEQSRDEIFGKMRTRQQIIPDADELKEVRTPWGIINLTRLNNIDRYTSEHAAAEIARDLELAHWLGVLSIQNLLKVGTGAGISTQNVFKEFGFKNKTKVFVNWMIWAELNNDVTELYVEGRWESVDKELVIEFNEGQFMVNGEDSDPDDAQVEFLLAHKEVVNFGTAFGALPSELKNTIKNRRGEFRWSLLNLNRQLAVELRKDARTLANKGRWVSEDGKITIEFKDGKFKVNGLEVDEDDAQVEFLLAHEEVTHFGAAFSALPSELKNTKKKGKGMFGWSVINLNRKLVVTLRKDAQKLAKEGKWVSTNGRVTIEFKESQFKVNAKVVDEDDAQVEFLLAHKDVVHFGNAFTALPSRLKNTTRGGRGTFDWSKLNSNRQLAVELRKDARTLANKGRWISEDGKITIEFKDGKFKVNGLEVDEDDAQVEFLLAHKEVMHFGMASTVLPSDLKNSRKRGRGKFDWSQLDLNRQVVVKLREDARTLARTGRWVSKDGKVSIEFKEGQFTVNGKVVDEDDAQVEFLLAHEDIVHFGEAFSVMPSRLKNTIKRGRGKFNWSQLSLNRQLTVDIRKNARTLARTGRWVSKNGKGTITYQRTDEGPMFTINGQRHSAEKAQVAFYFLHPGVVGFSGARSVIPKELKNPNRTKKGLFDWKEIIMSRSQAIQQYPAIAQLVGADAAMTVEVPLGSKMPLASTIAQLQSVDIEGKTSDEIRSQLFDIRETVAELPMEQSRDELFDKILARQQIIPEADELKEVVTPWGTKDLTKLNNIDRYSEHASAEIARDLELAHWLGLLSIKKLIKETKSAGISPQSVSDKLNLKGDKRVATSWMLREALYFGVLELYTSGEWTNVGKTLTIKFEDGEFFVNGKKVNSNDAQIEFLLAHEEVKHLGSAFTAFPSEIKNGKDGELGIFGWSRIELNQNLAVELRKNARALADTGTFTSPDGKTIIEFRDGEFYLNSQKAESNDAQVEFLLAHKKVNHFGNAFSALPFELKNTKRGGKGKFNWSDLNLNRKLATEFRLHARNLASRGEWSSQNGKGVITFQSDVSGPKFQINGQDVSPLQAQIAFYLLHPFTGFNGANSVTPKDLRNTRHEEGLFQWSTLRITRAQAIKQYSDIAKLVGVDAAMSTEIIDDSGLVEPQLVDDNPYAESLRNMLRHSTEEAVRRRIMIQEIGSEAQRLIRDYFDNQKIKISIVPQGSTLKGYAAADSDIEYDVLILAGMEDDDSGISFLIKKDRKAIQSMIKKLFEARGIEIDVEMDYVRVRNLSNIYAEAFTSSDLDFEEYVLALEEVFLPLAFGDPERIESIRKRLLEIISDQAGGEQIWKTIQERYSDDVNIHEESVREKPHLEEWLQSQGITQQNQIDRLNQSRALPSLEVMKQVYGVDQAMMSQAPGGIDLNPETIDMNIQGQPIDFEFPSNLPSTIDAPIQGLRPIIINITPVTNVPLLLGTKEVDKEELLTSL